MKHRSTIGATLMALVVIAASLAQAPSAGALTLFTFQGVASDALGRPLAGVKISDGAQSTYTGTDGSYSLPESNTGNFRLWATKLGLASRYIDVSVVVPTPTITEDFANMLYSINAGLSPSAFSTLNGPSSATLAITSWAPNPSCVAVADSRGGGGPATFVQQNADSSSTWTYSLDLPQGVPQGSYSLTYRTLDCSSGAVLSSVGTVSYLIDNTPPVIDPLSVLPQDGGNTTFTLQPLTARIYDQGGAGIKPSTIVFTLTDVTTGAVTTYQGSSVTYVSQYAKTNSVGLTVGHVYRVGVTASDWVGNGASFSQAPDASGGGFLAVTDTLHSTVASIPPTTCTVSDINTSGARTATCSNVPLLVNESTIDLSGTRHAGFGYVEQTVPLNGAVLETTVAGVTLTSPAYSQADPAWAPRKVSSQFVVLHVSDAPQTVTIGKFQVHVGTLTASVPAAWSSATLSMQPTATTASNAACATYIGSPYACTTDPVRFFMSNTVADDIIAAHAHDLDVLHDGLAMNTTQSTEASTALAYVSYWNSTLNHWTNLLPFCVAFNGGTVCSAVDSLVDYLQGQNRSTSYPAINPNGYASVCGAGVAWCWNPSLVTTYAAASPNVEQEKAQAIIWNSNVHYGRCTFQQGVNDQFCNKDWYNFHGSIDIDFDSSSSSSHSVCQGSGSTWHCKGFRDSENDRDGIGVGWGGSFFMQDTCTSGDGSTTGRCYPLSWPYAAITDQQGNESQCFPDGSADTNEQVYDFTNRLVAGHLPPQTGDASTVGLTNLPLMNNGSGASKMWNAGTWSGSQSPPSTDPNYQPPPPCQWATWHYAITADMFQYPDGNTDHSEMQTSFTHQWTTDGWDWKATVTEAFGPAQVTWTRDPESDSVHSWFIGSAGTDYTY